MANPESIPPIEAFRLNERVSFFVNHTLVILMLASASLTVVQLLQRLDLNYHSYYLPVVTVFVSLESIISSKVVRRKSDLNVYDLTYYFIEAIILMFLIKGLLYILGVGSFFQDLSMWQVDFFTYFFTDEFIFVLIFSAVIWILARSFASDLFELEVDEAIYKGVEIEAYPSDRGATNKRLMTRVFGVGFVMVFITALVFIDIQNLWANQGPPRSGTLNVVFYFILALILLSQTHFARMRWVWAWEHVPIGPGMARRWVLYSLIFLLVVGSIAFLLPTRYTLGLLTTLNYIVNLLYNLISIFFYLLFTPLIMLIGWIMSKIMGQAESTVEKTPQLLPPLEQQNQTPIPWLEILKSILFWAVLVGIVGYAFYQYFHQNQELVKKISGFPLISWLARFAKWLRNLVGGWNEKIENAVQAQIRRFRTRLAAQQSSLPLSFINLRRLSPRRRVLFFYLAMVRRGGETGIQRQPSQTPYEYAQSLKTGIPPENNVEPDINALTESFVEARYTPHEISEEHAGVVRRYWERLRSALRKIRKLERS